MKAIVPERGKQTCLKYADSHRTERKYSVGIFPSRSPPPFNSVGFSLQVYSSVVLSNLSSLLRAFSKTRAVCNFVVGKFPAISHGVEGEFAFVYVGAIADSHLSIFQITHSPAARATALDKCARSRADHAMHRWHSTSTQTKMEIEGRGCGLSHSMVINAPHVDECRNSSLCLYCTW